MLKLRNVVGFDKSTIQVLDEFKASHILLSETCPVCNYSAMIMHCHLLSTCWNIGFRDCEVIWCSECKVIYVPFERLDKK